MNRLKLLAMLMITALLAAIAPDDGREPVEAVSPLPDNVADREAEGRPPAAAPRARPPARLGEPASWIAALDLAAPRSR